MSDRFTQTRAEVTAWFFEDYLPRWVSASSGATDESPEFILDYWACRCTSGADRTRRPSLCFPA